MSTPRAKPAVSSDTANGSWQAIRSKLFQMDHRLDQERPRLGIRRFEGVHLPNIDIFRDDGIGQRFILRTARHIQMDSVRDFILTLPITSYSALHYREREILLAPGSFGFVSTAKPFAGMVRGNNGRVHFSQIVARIPGASLRQRLPSIDEWPNLSLRIRPGAGRLMASMLQWALNEGASLSKSQAMLFSQSLFETIVSALGEAPETQALQPEDSSSAHLRIREKAIEFVTINIANPLLDVALIARHCEVSERYVHAAFAAASLKVGTYVRHHRLEQCQAAFFNPANRSRSIMDIAMSWGFMDLNSFGRTYKAWCGRTPREERKFALQQMELVHVNASTSPTRPIGSSVKVRRAGSE